MVTLLKPKLVSSGTMSMAMSSLKGRLFPVSISDLSFPGLLDLNQKLFILESLATSIL